MSLILIALSVLDCLTVFSALTLLVESVFRCLLNKDQWWSETTGMMWSSSADVRTKNGMSVNELGFNWHLHKSFHSPIKIKFFLSTKKEIIYPTPIRWWLIWIGVTASCHYTNKIVTRIQILLLFSLLLLFTIRYIN